MALGPRGAVNCPPIPLLLWGLIVVILVNVQWSPPVAAPTAFGRPFLRFMALDDTWTFLNHGAFGATLQLALDVAHTWRCRVEKQVWR